MVSLSSVFVLNGSYCEYAIFIVRAIVVTTIMIRLIITVTSPGFLSWLVAGL